MSALSKFLKKAGSEVARHAGDVGKGAQDLAERVGVGGGSSHVRGLQRTLREEGHVGKNLPWNKNEQKAAVVGAAGAAGATGAALSDNDEDDLPTKIKKKIREYL